MQKHPDITLSRIDGFLGNGMFSDNNLRKALYKHIIDDSKHFRISVYCPSTEKLQNFRPTECTEFQPVSVGAKFGPLWATHWFKIEFTVPMILQGECIELEWFAGGAEGAIYLADETDNPLQAIGQSEEYNHTNYIIAQHANANETYTFFIESAINNTHMVPQSNQTCTLQRARVVVRNSLAHDIYYDMESLLGIARTLGHQQLYGAQALYVANEMINAFHSNDMENSLQAMKRISQSYFSTASFKEIDDNHSSSRFLNPRVYAVGHCHIDTAWLWPYKETIRKGARSWATQLQLMSLYPEHRFACSQAQQYAWVEKHYPSLFRRIQTNAIEKGQFIPVGGTWVEMDTNMPCGESLCRQFLYGQAYFLEKFHKKCQVFWLPDTFGYCAQLPQLALSAGMPYFMSQKLSWNNINRFPHSSFYWAGLDTQSRLLVHFPPSDTYNSMATMSDLLKSISSNKDQDRSSCSLLVFGFGDGGGGPQQDMLERLQSHRAQQLPPGLPRVKLDDPVKFFEDLQASSILRPLLTWKGELYFEFHRGTFTSQAYVKKMNRRCENLLKEAEFVCALLYDVDALCQLRKLWHSVLLNQFHDVLPGTSIHMVYKDDVHALYEQVQTEALDLLEKKTRQWMAIQEKPTVWMLNGSSYAYQQVVLTLPSNDDFRALSCQSNPQQMSAHHQPLIYASGTVCPSWSVNPLVNLSLPVVNEENGCCIVEKDGLFILSNSFVALKINENGEIISLFDKDVNRDVIVESRANRFVLYEDIPAFWDAWDIEIYYAEKELHFVKRSETQISVIESGPLRVMLLVIHDFEDCRIEQRISLTCANKLIEFDTHIPVWNASRKLLRVEFPVDIQHSTARYDVQYGFVERPTHTNTSWDMAKFEVCAHRYVDLSEHNYGVTLMNDAKYGHSCKGNVLGMSLLKSPKMPDPQCDMTSDRPAHQTHRFRYALYPHAGNFYCCANEILAKAIHFNSPPHLFGVQSIESADTPLLVANNNNASHLARKVMGAGSLFMCDAETVVVDIIKVPESVLDGKEKNRVMIVRLYESLGARYTKATLNVNGFIVQEADLCTILEESQQSLEVTSNHIILGHIRPFQVVTVKLYLSD